MPADRLLTQLEESRYRFGPGEGARVVRILERAASKRFTDPASLIRLHEALLFLRAFPHSAAVIRKTESVLRGFRKRVEQVRRGGADMDEFDTFEDSGIAGTRMSDTLTFDVARWLVRKMPGQVEVDWESYEEERAMGSTWPRFMPLLDEDGFVEANIPWRRWRETAQGSNSASAEWLVRRFEGLPASDREKAELYDSLRLPVSWELGNLPFSRTRTWQRPAKPFFHQAPLLTRAQVSLKKELSRRPPKLAPLSRRQGEAIMNRIREVMLVRYRELYGTTLGDSASVVRADVGRGVEIYLWNLPPSRRLPLRAYVAGFTLKNGVPINYIEAIGLFEWMEVGFNTFYTFRGGEVAWIYAQALRCLCRLMGTTCVSVYPYQIGQSNDEALESGAFWFYRKLGFRPGRADLLRLAEEEEKKIAAKAGYKTSVRTLRRLAEGHVFYELTGSEVGAWDRFSTRNIGLRVNRRMAEEFGGDARRIRKASAESVAHALGVRTTSWSSQERESFDDLALVLAPVSDLRSWTRGEREAVVRIIRTKSKPDEMHYLRLMQRHERLRSAFLKLGSSAGKRLS
jgi:hypothetical protein